MPYACLFFSDDIDASMRAAAGHIAESSAFEPHPLFHCPVIGTLHHYTTEDVTSACLRVTSGEPLPFIFGKWELSGTLLRATIESPAVSELAGRLHFELPLGRPWTSHYVTLGSVAAIDAGRRDEFLAAVTAAFPIDPTIRYTLHSQLEYNEHNLPQHNATSRPPRPTKPRAPKPRVPKPGGPKPHPSGALTLKSPHTKWERGKKGVPRPRAHASHAESASTPESAPTRMDVSTGATGSVRSVGIVKHSHASAARARRHAGPLARR